MVQETNRKLRVNGKCCKLKIIGELEIYDKLEIFSLGGLEMMGKIHDLMTRGLKILFEKKETGQVQLNST